jgi:hypothetical protein
MTGSFHEIQRVVTIIGVGELQRLYDSFKLHEPLIAKLVSE